VFRPVCHHGVTRSELAPRDSGKTRQALRFPPQRRLSERCELIVDPARSCVLPWVTRPASIMRSSEPYNVPGPILTAPCEVQLDLLHDVVAMPLLTKKGQQNVEHGRRQRHLGSTLPMRVNVYPLRI